MIFILFLVSGFLIASFYLSLTMLIPLGIVLLIDYFIYNVIIKKIRKNHGNTAKFLTLVIALPTIALAFFSVLAVKDYWISGEQKTYYEKRAERKAKDEAKGILNFKADIRNSKTPTLSITMTSDGNMKIPTLAHDDYTFVITNLIYFGDDTEPCGFEIKVTDKKSGKSETWRLHKNLKNFHSSENIRLEKTSDYSSLKNIVKSADGTLSANDKNWSINKPLCLDVLK